MSVRRPPMCVSRKRSRPIWSIDRSGTYAWASSDGGPLHFNPTTVANGTISLGYVTTTGQLTYLGAGEVTRVGEAQDSPSDAGRNWLLEHQDREVTYRPRVDVPN